METFLTIYGYKLTYLELIGSIFNFISIILATKANLVNWISSIICQVCFFFLFWNNSLYFNSFLQIYFVCVCIVAIFYWKKTDKEDNKGLRWMSNKQRIIWGISTVLSTILLYFVSKEFIPTDKLSPNLFLDVFVTVLSVIGVNLLSLKYIESWIIWLINDIVCVLLFEFSGIQLVMFEYILITGMAIYGLVNWVKISKLI